jgi:glycosyltransferase involved in cell wall biosynthesis
MSSVYRSSMLVVSCIPAKDEEKTIAQVVVRAMRHVSKVYVCDDGSVDLTGEIAKRLGAEVVRHNHNMGYGAAIATLFERIESTDADVVVTLDADGQHDPDDIPRLVEPILKGEADIVVGSRFFDGKDDQVAGYRKFGVNVITELTYKASHVDLVDAQSGFRAYSHKALPLVRPSEMGMGASTEIFLKAHEAGLKIIEVPVKISYDANSHNLHPLYQGVDVVMSTVKQYSIRHPLIFYGVPGFTSLVIASFFWFQTLETFVRSRAVITNVALIAVTTTMVGLMLLTTTIILWVMVSVIRER